MPATEETSNYGEAATEKSNDVKPANFEQSSDRKGKGKEKEVLGQGMSTV